MLSQLLQQTAQRYEAAVREVLADWSPECGCDRPGVSLHCEACPCLSVFERLVKDKIGRLANSPQTACPTTTPLIKATDETACIYIS